VNVWAADFYAVARIIKTQLAGFFAFCRGFEADAMFVLTYIIDIATQFQ
jgi:hypothetical protein